MVLFRNDNRHIRVELFEYHIILLYYRQYDDIGPIRTLSRTFARVKLCLNHVITFLINHCESLITNEALLNRFTKKVHRK